MDSARKSSVLRELCALVQAVCHTCCTQTSFRYCSTQSHLHASTCREKSLARAWKHTVLPLTHDREDQQDAADDDGDDDCSFSSPEVQHGNRVVELSNLDLRREKEGGKAGAEQVSKGLGAGRGTGQNSADLHPRTHRHSSAAGEGAGLCLSLPELGTLRGSRSPIPRALGDAKATASRLRCCSAVHPRSTTGLWWQKCRAHGPSVPAPEETALS